MSVLSHWRRQSIAFATLVFSSVLVSCDNDAVGPSRRFPAGLNAVGSQDLTGVVGAIVDGGLTVQVTDSSGNPLSDQSVAFAVTAGNGSTNPRLATTDAEGRAKTDWTLGTIPGRNEVTATVTGVTGQIKFQATGSPGPVVSIALTPRSARLLVGSDSTLITVRSLDAYGNRVTSGPTLVARDPTLVSVEQSGVVRVLRRGASTWVVASAASVADSILITVLAPGEGICTGSAVPLELAIGQVLTDVDPAAFCVRATTASTEYAVVPFYDTTASAPSVQLSLQGEGLSVFTLPNATILATGAARATMTAPAPTLTPDFALENQLRKRERSEGEPRMAAARAAWQSRRSAQRSARSVAAALALPAAGDLVSLNVNAMSYCTSPDLRVGRVVAVTDKAIVVADTANPPGGFTDAEYRSFGVTFDTLVEPVDRAAFGAPTDIDSNGHIILFFTRAVNELTSAGSPNGVFLGYFYNRDLLPKSSTTPGAACAASNEAEVMFLLAPDTGGVVNGNRRSKAQVLAFSSGTVAHEYQHMINAGRRLYVNGVGQNFEDRWLDEGLAHVAEELNFWRASGRSTRSNLDASIFSDSRAAEAYATYEQNNFSRYRTYLATPETQAPIGSATLDDDLPTRGAAWNFLRFAADHQTGEENDFWFKLVNSTTHGIANLSNALGSAPGSLLRDWAISVFLDDDATGVDPRFSQPSWNLRSTLTTSTTGFPLVTHFLSDGVAAPVTLYPNGVSFYRFSVANGTEALLTVSTASGPVPSGVRVAVVRVR